MRKTKPLPLREGETTTLVELGLTRSEAKVYLALIQIGPSQIGHISKATGIHREHLYHTVHSLEDRCLIEKELGSAAKYKAISVDEALPMLVECKQTQTSELKTKAEIIVENFKKKKNNLQRAAIKELQDENSQFVIVPGKEVGVQRLREAIQKVQTSLDVVTSRQRFSSGILEFAETFNIALERGVKIRIATERHVAEKAALEIVRSLKKNPCFEVKYLPDPPQALVGIFDKKEAHVTLSSTANLKGTSGLWSNNTSLIVLAQTYFESKWSNSLEEYVR